MTAPLVALIGDRWWDLFTSYGILPWLGLGALLYFLGTVFYTFSFIHSFLEEEEGDLATEDRATLQRLAKTKGRLFLLNQLFYIGVVLGFVILVEVTLVVPIQAPLYWLIYLGVMTFTGLSIGRRYRKFHFRQGQFYEKIGELRQACWEYEKVVESFFSPSSLREKALYRLGKCREERGQVPENIWAYRSYKEQFPEGQWIGEVERNLIAYEKPSSQREDSDKEENSPFEEWIGQEREIASELAAKVKNSPSLSTRGSADSDTRKVGDFLLVEKLGEGGFGEVWKARHRILENRWVALKLPRGEEQLSSLKKLAKAQSRLDSPHIAKVDSIHLEGEEPYVALEFVPGIDLRSLMDREGPLAPREATYIFQSLIKGLNEAHLRGVIHRDLKPENILISEKGEVKITDFDLSHAENQGLSTSLNWSKEEDGEKVKGTLLYMAPEQMQGEKVDGRADLYSAGVILFEMLTGELPQPSDRLEEFDSSLPRELAEIFAGCYTRLDRRFQRSQEIGEKYFFIETAPAKS